MGRTQELSLTIEAPAADVWKALTDAEELTRWFVPEARVVPGVGGSLWMSWGGGMEGTTHITDWEPNRRMRTADELPSGGTRIRTPWTGGVSPRRADVPTCGC